MGMYLTLKKKVEDEQWFHVKETHLDPERLKSGLLSGEFNIIRVELHENLRWVVNKSGRRVAVLDHDGGFGPSEEIEVKVDGPHRDWSPDDKPPFTVVFE
jgi:hypothetical protein